MLKSFNEKRVFLPKKVQRVLFENILKKISVRETAKIGEVSERTIRDWKRSKYSMNYSVIRNICRAVKISIPRSAQYKDRYWFASKSGRIGGQLVYKKYGQVGGNQNYRLKKWREWWNREGKFKAQPILKQLPIKKSKYSLELAEFFGIMIGDGGITKRQVTVTLNSESDKKYVPYVSNLMRYLFGIIPNKSTRKKQKAVSLCISRSELVNFLHAHGLKIGNKIRQELDIPSWILSRKSWTINCIKGIMDTDGSVFGERHKYKDKVYNYPRIHFVSASEKLLNSIYKILCSFDLKPFLRHNARRVSIERAEDIEKYFNVFGTSNPKHKSRYKELVGRVG